MSIACIDFSILMIACVRFDYVKYLQKNKFRLNEKNDEKKFANNWKINVLKNCRITKKWFDECAFARDVCTRLIACDLKFICVMKFEWSWTFICMMTRTRRRQKNRVDNHEKHENKNNKISTTIVWYDCTQKLNALKRLHNITFKL